MDHVIDRWAVHCWLMSRAKVLWIGWTLHRRAYIFITNIFQCGHEQIELKDELAYLLILPNICIYLWRALNYLSTADGSLPTNIFSNYGLVIGCIIVLPVGLSFFLCPKPTNPISLLPLYLFCFFSFKFILIIPKIYIIISSHYSSRKKVCI